MNIKEQYGLTQKEYDEVLEIIDRTFDESEKSYTVSQYLCYAQMVFQTIFKRMMKESDVINAEKCEFIMKAIAYNIVQSLGKD